MTTLVIIASIIFILWMVYSGWASPLMRENEDGSWTTLRPEKKFSDLFKKQTQIKKEDVFVDKDAFQTLAGIKPHNKEAVPFNPINNKLNENIVEQLKRDFENSQFPKSDDSLNVRTTKISTIDTNFGSDNDPLASVPMSRVSKEAKQKMAEIARGDINRQLKEQTSNLHPTLKAEMEKELEDANKIIMGNVLNDQRLGMDFKKPTNKKRKPKTVKENEAEFELGGSE